MPKASKPMNILFVMADQLAARCLPVYGHDVVKTPNIDALCENAVVFDSAYTNSPLCAPSRFCLMTGQLPDRIKAYDNASDLPSDIPTVAHYLRRAGYRTALSGKMHFCGADQLHGYEDRLTADIYPADYGWYCDWDNFDDRPTWYHNMGSVTQAGPVYRSNQLDFDDETAFEAKRYLYDVARQKKHDDRPFFLTVSFTHPHDPYNARPEFWDMYDGGDIDPVRVKIPKDDLDPHSQRLRHVYNLDQQPVTDDEILQARRAYYASISYVDSLVGSLMQTLRETGMDENTLVVFSGDHGDMLGERGMWYKMSWFEPSARVPMFFAFPRAKGQKRVSQSVSLIDILPTLRDLAGDTGSDPADPIDGRSLVPHLQGTGGHDEVIGEYCGEGALSPIIMIRRGAYKYIASGVDPDMLYDLKNDPDELRDLINDPAHRETRDAFRAELSENWDLEAFRERVIHSQKRRKLVYEALTQGHITSWDHQPKRDTSTMYMRNHLDLDDVEMDARLTVPRAGAAGTKTDTKFN
ncbi:choline-sulfatase [Thalassospira alkalitolerans]|uniref:choline-sulfatase n=1 Tax=Thalassospira alkalitolerans TaxID=1293890 RepID=UPI001FEAABF1|nr:choline-sulfatase [Thalassospira alkalitolerans]